MFFCLILSWCITTIMRAYHHWKISWSRLIPFTILILILPCIYDLVSQEALYTEVSPPLNSVHHLLSACYVANSMV